MTKQREVFWFTPKGIAAIGLIGAVSYFLFVEHQQHIFSFLPFLILLACPLMHIFMHRGHGGHDHKDHRSDKGSLDEAYRRGLEDGKEKSDHQNHDHRGKY
ncbi:DUF2933 domain-containing protein [Motiliproteus sp. MSK22-1]|uniref:DUF2933 domain-containing protein n=1 Tax=Motiliproteus sp. MSK22-1 TaxID=1897630 RepID=UPI0009759D92|nr:DUF2933 domain-containing protein [Motiliproteus sp. MSK22-1]OMH31771.1 hypothetical protein BGP75_16785 [Motiliproteus sp. MSK22-1]